MRRPSSNIIIQYIILVLLVVSVYAIFVRPYLQAIENTAGGPQVKQGSDLLLHVLNKVNVSEKSLWETNRPPIEVQAFRKKVRLDFFGILDSARQEQVFEAVKEWQSTNQNMGVVWVRFYEPEKPRGEYGQHIETLLREEFIVLTNIQSGVIFNQVTPKN